MRHFENGRDSRGWPRKVPWHLAGLVLVLAAGVGIGLAWGSNSQVERSEALSYDESEVLPVTTVSTTLGPSDLNGGFPCQLIGRTAADASEYFSRIGITVRWALETPTSPEGDGHRSTPASVPIDSIVMDVSRVDARTVVAGVHGADDLTHNTPAPKPDKDC